MVTEDDYHHLPEAPDTIFKSLNDGTNTYQVDVRNRTEERWDHPDFALATEALKFATGEVEIDFVDHTEYCTKKKEAITPHSNCYSDGSAARTKVLNGLVSKGKVGCGDFFSQDFKNDLNTLAQGTNASSSNDSTPMELA